MTSRIISCATLALSILAMVLTIAYGLRLEANGRLRGDIDARQQQLNGGQMTLNIYQGLVQNLAGFAIEQKDAAVRELLTKEGINLPEQKPGETKPVPQNGKK